MSNTLNRLKEFQEALTERLRHAAEQPQRQSRLAVMVGDRGYLLNLDDIAEVAPEIVLTPVPLTRPWFLGVANVRGGLYAISDFAAWLGARSVSGGVSNRTVLLGHRLAKHRVGVAVSRVIGLRLLDEMQPADRVMERSWEVASWTDRDGSAWIDVDLGRLMVDPDFLQIIY